MSHNARQQCLKVPRQVSHGGSIEQVGVVLQAPPERFPHLRHFQGEVKLSLLLWQGKRRQHQPAEIDLHIGDTR